jgi:hypothetical protein
VSSAKRKKWIINKNILKENANKIAADLGIINFRNSNGFIYRFLKGNKLTKRVGTHVIQKVTYDVIYEVKKFMIDIRKERLSY